MPTVTVLDDTFSDATTINVSARAADVGGAWTDIEAIAGNGLDSARVLGGTGNAHSSSGAAQSGNRTGLVLTAPDWDIYFDVVRPSGVFGSVWLMGGANAAGAGGWTLVLSNFSDRAVLQSDSSSFAARGTDREIVDHAMPSGTSTYQLRKRGAVLTMLRNGAVLGSGWTDPDPASGNGCVAFAATQSDNLAISRVWATIEAPDTALAGNLQLDDAAPTGTLQSNPPSTLTGNITTDAAAPTGSISSGAAPGTVVLGAWRNKAGMALPNQPVARVTLQRLADGVQVLNLAGLTTSASPTAPQLSLTNAALVPGTFYVAVANNADGTVLGVELVQAV